MNRILYTFVLVFPLFSNGCNQQVATDASNAVPTEKTGDDLRAYLQENIDRYLGGQNTTEQLNKLTIHFMIVVQANGSGIADIKIVSVLQAYSDSGEKESNQFIARLLFSKGQWHSEETIRYFFKNGSWMNI